ncbi:MAG: hypothetical protein QOK10_522 [Pseudonocardiales bacterium]|jgi:hypothetical protein|nr:hypothetical protein [Pseudonocardiales bacterium]
MTRLLFEVIVLALIVAAGMHFVRQLGDHVRGRNAGPVESLVAPPGSTWHAVNHGTAKEQTEILVVLLDPGSNRVWDRRSCDLIDNRDPDYDKRVYNAMEDARARAALLNSLRDQ